MQKYIIGFIVGACVVSISWLLSPSGAFWAEHMFK